WMPVVGGGSGTLASATTTDLGSIAETFQTITGTTTITGLGSTAPVGSVKFLNFASSGLTLTYNATSLILPGAASHTTASANETAIAVSLGSGNWQVLMFSTPPPSGALLTANTFTGIQTFSAATVFNNSMNFNEAALTVASGVTTWNMTTQGPDVSITWSSANNLTIANQTASPTGPARGTIRIVNSTGATRSISWGTNYNTLSAALPSTIALGQQIVLRYWTQGSSVYIIGLDTLAAPTVTTPTPHITIKTSGSAYTTNAATKWTKVTVIGGGAGGGNGASYAAGGGAGGGGGGGGVAIKVYTNLAPSTSYTYAVGAAGGSSTFTDGTTLITGSGGSGGSSAVSTPGGAGGAGGTGTNGDTNITGFTGGYGSSGPVATGATAGAGGATIYGLYIVSSGTFYGTGGLGGYGGPTSSAGGVGSAGLAGAVVFEEWY
ncbi:MAG: hypothetical protein M3O03_02795, partial [Pseudomonadota bacterium]|nr:hypothetical protein [Pseudomonadota bacterium]